MDNPQVTVDPVPGPPPVAPVRSPRIAAADFVAWYRETVPVGPLTIGLCLPAVVMMAFSFLFPIAEANEAGTFDLGEMRPYGYFFDATDLGMLFTFGLLGLLALFGLAIALRGRRRKAAQLVAGCLGFVVIMLLLGNLLSWQRLVSVGDDIGTTVGIEVETGFYLLAVGTAVLTASIFTIGDPKPYVPRSIRYPSGPPVRRSMPAQDKHVVVTFERPKGGG